MSVTNVDFVNKEILPSICFYQLRAYDEETNSYDIYEVSLLEDDFGQASKCGVIVNDFETIAIINEYNKAVKNYLYILEDKESYDNDIFTKFNGNLNKHMLNIASLIAGGITVYTSITPEIPISGTLVIGGVAVIFFAASKMLDSNMKLQPRINNQVASRKLNVDSLASQIIKKIIKDESVLHSGVYEAAKNKKAVSRTLANLKEINANLDIERIKPTRNPNVHVATLVLKN